MPDTPWGMMLFAVTVIQVPMGHLALHSELGQVKEHVLATQTLPQTEPGTLAVTVDETS